MNKLIFWLVLVFAAFGAPALLAAQEASQLSFTEDPRIADLFSRCTVIESEESYRADPAPEHRYEATLRCPTSMATPTRAARALYDFGYRFVAARGGLEAVSSTRELRLSEMPGGFRFTAMFKGRAQVDLGAKLTELIARHTTSFPRGVRDLGLQPLLGVPGARLYEVYVARDRDGNETVGVGTMVADEGPMSAAIRALGFESIDGRTWLRPDGSRMTRAYPRRYLLELRPPRSSIGPVAQR